MKSAANQKYRAIKTKKDNKHLQVSFFPKDNAVLLEIQSLKNPADDVADVTTCHTDSARRCNMVSTKSKGRIRHHELPITIDTMKRALEIFTMTLKGIGVTSTEIYTIVGSAIDRTPMGMLLKPIDE